MMHKYLTSSLPIAAIAVLLAIHLAAQSRYTFTRIADTNGFPGGIQAPVALNDAGQVAFVAAPTDTETGVFVGNGQVITTAADTTSAFTFFGFPGINGAGQPTFFAAKTNQRHGYYAGMDGAVTIVEDRGAVHNFGGDVFSSPSGSFSTVEVVLSLPRSAEAIVASEGGRAIRIADTSGIFQLLDGDPRVNAAGLVAFHARRRDSSQGIFVGKGGALTTIADTSGPFLSFKDSPAVNDRGEVLFQAELNGSNGGRISGLFLSSHGRIRTVVDSSGAFVDFGEAPGLNSEGQIAFVGVTRSGLVGIFTGDDPIADRVIAVDDPLDGSTVSGLETFWSSLNNDGQIAFVAELADGRTAIYRADPARVHHARN